jgi:hypothetical protein
MKRALLALTVVVALAGLGGCGAKKAPVTITNDLGAWDIHYVYISPENSDEWGEDLLGEDEILEDGEELTTEVEVGTYDIRLVDEDQDTYTRNAVEVTEEGYSWEVTLADLD